MSDSYVTPFFDNGGRLMVTNNGNHPPDLWAQVIAEHIAPINNEMTGHRRISALTLQSKIQNGLEEFCKTIQAVEQTNLTASEAHLLSELDASMHLDSAVKLVQELAKDTDWENHFNNDDVVSMIKGIMDTHFRTMQFIERSWHVDKNPNHSLAAKFIAMKTGAV